MRERVVKGIDEQIGSMCPNIGNRLASELFSSGITISDQLMEASGFLVAEQNAGFVGLLQYSELAHHDSSSRQEMYAFPKEHPILA